MLEADDDSEELMEMKLWNDDDKGTEKLSSALPNEKVTFPQQYEAVNLAKKLPTSKTDITKNLKDKSKNRLRNTRFECSLCPKIYLKSENLAKHIVRVHVGDEDKSFQCDLCLNTTKKVRKFIDQKSLSQHIKIIHGPPRFKCTVCFRTFNDSSNFTRHNKETHQVIPDNQCDFCLGHFKSKASLRGHLLSQHKEHARNFEFKSFECEFCSKLFLHKCILESHVVREHVVDKAFECQVCCKTFIDEESLEQHFQKRHNKAKRAWVCQVCSRKFTNPISFKRHLETKHQKFFHCNKCKLSFSNQSEFDKHRNFNDAGTSNSKPFQCTICLETFTTQCNFSIHTEQHLKELKKPQETKESTKSNVFLNKIDSEPPQFSTATTAVKVEEPECDTNKEFNCEFCLKSFTQKKYYSSHMQIVHKNATWSCTSCSKTYKYRHRLKIHELSHIQSRSFQCQMCPKAFFSSINLKIHERIHADNKRFKCEICFKPYNYSRELKSHMINYHYNGEKPFKCHLCPVSCRIESQLKFHLLSHKNGKPFKCDKCFLYFKHPKYLKKHVRTVHSFKSENFLSKRKARSKIMSTFSDPSVFVCTERNCSFEAKEGKEIALHYNAHGLPKVIIESLSTHNPRKH